MLVKRNMQIPMDFECFGIARRERRRFPEKKVLHGILGGANKGLGEAPKAARGRSMKARPTQSRGGVKGQLPLAGSRDSVPCGVWGNAPTVPRATSMPNALNKGAGSEASLPVTLRVRRRAPKLLFPQDSVKNQIFGCGGQRKRTAPFCRTVRRNYFRRVMTMWRLGSSPSEWVSTSSLGWSAE